MRHLLRYWQLLRVIPWNWKWRWLVWMLLLLVSSVISQCGNKLSGDGRGSHRRWMLLDVEGSFVRRIGILLEVESAWSWLWWAWRGGSGRIFGRGHWSGRVRVSWMNRLNRLSLCFVLYYELACFLLQPRIEFNDQVTLIHLILDISLYFLVIFAW